MTRSARSETPAKPALPRKPRILIAGEFSAGKTQLISGLLGQKVLPSNVTSTSLPPVWLISGHQALLNVNLEGTGRRLDTLDGVDVATTHFCILSHPAPFLKNFEIIDTPGNSDPNIPPESWERMLPFADAVIWCTNATQAWRQSEKSVWKEMPARLRTHATLLITHADRMTDDHQAGRVMRRVQREAGEFFSNFLMASLLNPSDLDRIAAHIAALPFTDEALGGADSKILRDFSLSDAVTVKSRPKTATQRKSTVSPHRIRRSKSAADVLPSADVYVLTSVPAAPEAAPGHAQALWDELLPTLDQSSPAALLAAVSTLIARLDRRPEASGEADATSNPDHDSTLIHDVKSRRIS
jgi:hypothetical protein